MQQLFIFLLSSYALWFVFAQSELPGWSQVRDWLSLKSATFTKLILCPLCSGFWCALAVSSALNLRSFSAAEMLSCVVWALAGAASTYLIELHVDRIAER